MGNGKRIGLVAASDYSTIKPALCIFERNTDDLFSMDSPTDTQRLADLLSQDLKIGGGLLPISIST